MKKRTTLLIDAFINLILGILLLFFNSGLAALLGVPASNTNFYPNILGGIFIGITLALAIEALKKEESRWVGLGLMGAISINMSGGIILTLWLVFGGLKLPVQGLIFLWSLAIILLIISSVELIFNIKRRS
ncbi:MAG: hypothetical protein JXR71_02755 [Bacteroidales bacterium]|nr:hypothetical protein [Bacteroidales bacterium]